MNALLSRAEEQRLSVAAATDRGHKSAMGQFMTPASTAHFMASLFGAHKGPIRLLDPGAGLGALTCATLDRWQRGQLPGDRMAVVAHELDDRLRVHLEQTLAPHAHPLCDIEIRGGDYLLDASKGVLRGEAPYTHAILNPPYKKIGVDSEGRFAAHDIGLTVVNLYAAFVGMALAQLRPKGQLVCIIPRSFCNGPYYKPFRQWILERSAIQHIHLFGSRTQAFKDDAVLQENVILLLRRGAKQGDVTVSTSTDDTFDDLTQHTVPFASVVKPHDPDLFFHVAVSTRPDALESAPRITSRLADLDLTVSTGPVVSFRMRDHLVPQPTKGTVPLLYPAHFKGTGTSWPIAGFKKANAIALNEETRRWLYPAGTYLIVRRMSSKEERKRVVAALVQSSALGNPKFLGLDNGLNFFHSHKQPLDDTLAWGLLVYLSSTAVDEHFRRFNGHTQVNATDLRNIPYPSRADLLALGEWANSRAELSQSEIDHRMEGLLHVS
jgi:adenine-specific DNA-methyltransferase